MSIGKLLGYTSVALCLSASVAVAQYWTPIRTTTDSGDAICGVTSIMQSGGSVSLMITTNMNGVHMVFSSPKWRFRERAEYDIGIVIDGRGYRGRTQVVNSQTLGVYGLSRDFVYDFIHGNNLTAYLGSERWTLSLSDSLTATKGMVTCIEQEEGYNPFSR